MVYAELLWVDRLGMYVRAEVFGRSATVVRVPFYRPVLDERDARYDDAVADTGVCLETNSSTTSSAVCAYSRESVTAHQYAVVCCVLLLQPLWYRCCYWGPFVSIAEELESSAEHLH